VLPFFASARCAPPHRCGRLQARRRAELLPRISPFAIDLRAPRSPRALTRARYGGAALGFPSCGPARARSTMARSARACCAGAAAKAPTPRAARRNRRRMWCLGLRLDTHGGGGGGGGDGSYSCSTPSSCDGVECVFAFPTGEARHRARRCTQVRCRRRLQRRPDGDGSKRKRQRIVQGDVGRRPSRTGGGDDGAIVFTRRAPPSSLHAPRPAIVASPQRLLPRTDVGAAAACAAGLRPPPIRPAAWEASVGGVRGFR